MLVCLGHKCAFRGMRIVFPRTQQMMAFLQALTLPVASYYDGSLRHIRVVRSYLMKYFIFLTLYIEIDVSA